MLYYIKIVSNYRRNTITIGFVIIDLVYQQPMDPMVILNTIIPIGLAEESQKITTIPPIYVYVNIHIYIYTVYYRFQRNGGIVHCENENTLNKQRPLGKNRRTGDWYSIYHHYLLLS